MGKGIKVFFVEDEIALGKIVMNSLESRGYYVDYFRDGKTALEKLYQKNYDILVVDVMLPGIDGFTLIEKFRKMNTTTPVIFLTARSMTRDVVNGFEIGGNDYLKKPFSMEELIVRIKALIGRNVNAEKDSSVQIGEYNFNFSKQLLRHKTNTIQITYREAELLKMLSVRRNQVLERKYALTKLWGDDHFFNARSMDVFITKLRKYFKKDPTIQILNIRGVGFKLIC